ncbi:protein phosphatase 1 regulatory subunit 14C isoform X2 [Atheta coriaria]|uniref:protein phosphatase 1 regulatory subunit 14C isoform X2 n=1 Tax=Dalotia coriaria TaxID=877792 RepID=UPI0031F3FDF4
MTSKFRRSPLLTTTYDGFGLRAQNARFNTINKGTPSSNVTNINKQTLNMECGITGAYANGTSAAGGILADVRTERSPSKAGLHVNFKEKGEVKEKREKFLTAKYGNHQMSLIRKRLAVEMWLYEELKKLYETKVDSNEEVEVDIDELLDMDSDEERRRHLHALLINAKKSQNDVKKFINDLLDKAKTL